MTVDPYYLGTSAAKDRQTMRWADGRAAMHFVPEFVQTEWNIEVE